MLFVFGSLAALIAVMFYTLLLSDLSCRIRLKIPELAYDLPVLMIITISIIGWFLIFAGSIHRMSVFWGLGGTIFATLVGVALPLPFSFFTSRKSFWDWYEWFSESEERPVRPAQRFDLRHKT